MNTRVAGIFVAVLTVLAAFGTAYARQRRAAESESRKAIDAVNKEIIRACQERDFDASAALWADDGVDLLPGLAPMVGKAKIVAWLDSLRPRMEGTKMRYCTIDWQDIQIHGDIAYEWGINRQFIEYPPPRKSAPTEGKILYILKRQPDGQWKVSLEAWNGSPQA